MPMHSFIRRAQNLEFGRGESIERTEWVKAWRNKERTRLLYFAPARIAISGFPLTPVEPLPGREAWEQDEELWVKTAPETETNNLKKVQGWFHGKGSIFSNISKGKAFLLQGIFETDPVARDVTI